MRPSAEYRECVLSTIRRVGLSLDESRVFGTAKYEGSTVETLPWQTAGGSSGDWRGEISGETARSAMESLFDRGLIEVCTNARREDILLRLRRSRIGPIYGVPRSKTVTLTDAGAILARDMEQSLLRVTPWLYARKYLKQRSSAAIPHQMLCYGYSVEQLRSLYVHKTLENGHEVVHGVMPLKGHYPGEKPLIAHPPIVVPRPRFYMHWFNWIEPCVLMRWDIIRQHSAGD